VGKGVRHLLAPSVQKVSDTLFHCPPRPQRPVSTFTTGCQGQKIDPHYKQRARMPRALILAALTEELHYELLRVCLLLTCRARFRLRERERQVLARIVAATDGDDDVLPAVGTFVRH